MKKRILTVTLAVALCGIGLPAVHAADETVSGGRVNFIGQVVNTACTVSSDSIDQIVRLDQVRAAKLNAAGKAAGQQKAFEIVLKDCDISVHGNASVTFNAQSDGTLQGALANTAGAGAAANVALQLYGPDGSILKLQDESSTIVLVDGTNVIPLSVDYVATQATVTPGEVAASATFRINYS